MKIKIGKNQVIYLLLIFALLNAPLRLSDHGMTSFFRLLSPAICLIILCKHWRKYGKSIVIVGMLFLYNFIVSMIFYKHISFDQIIFVLYVFFIYVLIKYLKNKDEHFEKHFWNFINICTILTLIFALIQRYTGYVLPYLEPTMGKGAANVFLSNENELGSAFACVLIIYFYLLIFHKKNLYFLPSILVLFIIFINDAKLSLIGVMIATLIFIIYKLRDNSSLKFLKDKSFFHMLIILGVTALVLVYVLNPSFKFRDYNITIRELFFDAVFSIIQGKELNTVGSIHDRTSAIIYGFKELGKTFLFGIGLGNSIEMLKKPEYILQYAKSMHNIICQFIVEYGYLAMFVYAKIICYIIRLFKGIKREKACLLKACFAVALIFISSQSSVGILSNYYTIMVTMFIFIMDGKSLDTYMAKGKEGEAYVKNP